MWVAGVISPNRLLIGVITPLPHLVRNFGPPWGQIFMDEFHYLMLHPRNSTNFNQTVNVVV